MPPLSAITESLSGKLFLPRDTKPSFSGRTVLVTGGNAGLGRAAALKFVQLGAERVVLGARDLGKGKEAKGWIERESGREGVVDVWELDMMDYESMKKFAKRVEDELEKLDVVCLNAGLMAARFEVSAYGWERDIQTNLLSTVYLSLLLLPKLLQISKIASTPPVLELVSSGTHYQISLPPEARSATSPIEYFNSSATFRTFEQYSITKLFLQHCQTHLCHLFPSDPPPVSIITVCPGAVETGISRELDGWLVGIGKRVVGPLIMKAPEQGARTYISGIGLGVEGHGKFWTADRIKEPAPLLQGKGNEKFGKKVWEDVLRILRRDVGEGEVDGVLKRIQRACSEEEV